jgi:hypothetical protein
LVKANRQLQDDLQRAKGAENRCEILAIALQASKSGAHQLQMSLLAANKEAAQIADEAKKFREELDACRQSRQNAERVFTDAVLIQSRRIEELEKSLKYEWDQAAERDRDFRCYRDHWFAERETLQGQMTSLLRALKDCQQKEDATS